MDRILDSIMDMVLPVFLMGTIVLSGAFVLIGIPWLLFTWWQDSHSPTFELRKDEWVCTASHEETSTTLVMVGKVMVPMTSTSSVCDRLERRR